MSALALPAWVLDAVLLFTVLEFGLPGLAFRVAEPTELLGPSLACLAFAGLVHMADLYRRFTRCPVDAKAK